MAQVSSELRTKAQREVEEYLTRFVDTLATPKMVERVFDLALLRAQTLLSFEGSLQALEPLPEVAELPEEKRRKFEDLVVGITGMFVQMQTELVVHHAVNELIKAGVGRETAQEIVVQLRAP